MNGWFIASQWGKEVEIYDAVDEEFINFWDTFPQAEIIEKGDKIKMIEKSTVPCINKESLMY